MRKDKFSGSIEDIRGVVGVALYSQQVSKFTKLTNKVISAPDEVNFLSVVGAATTNSLQKVIGNIPKQN